MNVAKNVKVNKIFNDFENWSSNYFDLNKYKIITNKCGAECDDCASIFENDSLGSISELSNGVSIEMELL